MTKYAVLSLVCVAVIAGPAMAYPVTGVLYDADAIVPLPVPPNPEYTNYTSGRIDAMNYTSDNPLDYTIVVENELDPIRWKEFLYQLTIVQYNPEDYVMDFHIDFSTTNPAWYEDPQQPQFLCEAYWQTLIAGTPNPAPASWTVVGYPGNNSKAPISPVLALAGPQIDQWIDLMLPPFDGTKYYDWNPQWVSLEFSGYGFAVDYDFTDWCIPEPASLALLGIGAVTLLRRKLTVR